MALTRTFLSAAIKASDLLIPVSSTAIGYPPVATIVNPSQPVQIDNEIMFLVQVPVANQLLVRSRGSDGQVAIAHDVNAPVVTSATIADFQTLAPGQSTLHPLTAPDNVSY